MSEQKCFNHQGMLNAIDEAITSAGDPKNVVFGIELPDGTYVPCDKLGVGTQLGSTIVLFTSSVYEQPDDGEEENIPETQAA
jgi:hypothetical protein